MSRAPCVTHVPDSIPGTSRLDQSKASSGEGSKSLEVGEGSGRTRKRSAIKLQHGEKLLALQATLKNYSELRKRVRQNQDNIINKIDELFRVSGMDDEFTKHLRAVIDELMIPVEAFTTRDPVILVSGQINSGKSSLVNLILERKAAVPVKSTPCTPMITRLKYSKDEYYQLFDPDGEPRSEKLKLNAKALSRDVDLMGEEREGEAVQWSLEIGLDSPILEYGIQIYDLPGTNENKKLDAVVEGVIDGFSQVLLYVIDGNHALDRQDQAFIEHLYEEYPDLVVLYVCNKCEVDRCAATMDAPDEDVELIPADAALKKSRRLSKGEEVFEKLVNLKESNAIPLSEATFFPLSCKRIRTRSKSTEYEEFIKHFHRLVESLITKFEECACRSLANALDSLYALATQVFDYFVANKFLDEPVWELLAQKLGEAKEKEDKAFGQLQNVIEEKCKQINQTIHSIIKRRYKDLAELVYCQTCNTDLADEVIDFTSQVQAEKLADIYHRVVYKEIMKEIDYQEIIKSTHTEIFNTIDCLLQECKQIEGVGDIVSQMKTCYSSIDPLPNGVSPSRETTFKKSFASTLKSVVVKVLRKPESEISRNEKGVTLKEIQYFIKRLDDKFIGKSITAHLSEQISKSHKRFLSNIERIITLHDARKSKSADLKLFIPLFSWEICNLQTLMSDAKSSLLHDHSGSFTPWSTTTTRCRSGHRFEVILTGVAPNISVQKRLAHCGEESEEDYKKWAEILNFGRMMQINHEHLMTSFDLEKDIRTEDGFLINVEYSQTNLFLGLSMGMKLPLKERMHISRKIVGACVYLSERGFKANDLRPSNILLHRWEPKIDLTKWKSLTTPYPKPDDLPPFHFAPEAVAIDIPSGTGQTTYDTYSCVILLWLLYIGKFIRPKFAKDSSFDRVADAICKDRVRPDLVAEMSGATVASTDSKAAFAEVSQLIFKNIVTNPEERLSIGELLDVITRLCLKCELVQVKLDE